MSATPGWYPDGTDQSRLRWWDGEQWTEHTMPYQTSLAVDAAGSVEEPSPRPRWKVFAAVGVALLAVVGVSVVRDDAPPSPDGSPIPTTPDGSSPAPAAGSRVAASVAVGVAHSCALTVDGAVLCWGRVHMETPEGPQVDTDTPELMQGLESGVRQISAGRLTTCALLESGEVRCWGLRGSLPGPVDYQPTTLPGLESGVRSIGLGAFHGCAVMDSGAVRCWGENSSGQLGSGSTDPVVGPVDVAGLPSPAVHVAGGADHTCALLENGDVWCWGGNEFRQIDRARLDVGNLDSPGQYVVPFGPVLSRGSSPEGLEASRVVSLDLGSFRSCAVQVSGAVCWGVDPGSGESTVVNWMTDLKLLAPGFTHDCELDTLGALNCSGSNASGQWGDGDAQAIYNTSGFVVYASGVVDVSVFGDHSCAVLDDGSVHCWGSNEAGESGVPVGTPIVDAPNRIAGFGD